MMRRTLSGIPVSPSNRPAVVVLLIFGVLWTGISAVIALFTWLFGMPLLFLTFPVLFMLIGAVMVAWCCLALFTGAKFGTLDFTVSKQSLRPGDELSVRYALPFRAGMTVERVVIRLVRRERAMFRRESNTVAALDDHVEQEVEHAGRRYQAGETASGDAMASRPPARLRSPMAAPWPSPTRRPSAGGTGFLTDPAQ